MTDPTRPADAPWVIDVVALGVAKRDGAGTAHPLDLTGPAPEQTTNGVLTVPTGTDVTVVGLLEGAMEGVVVSAAITAPAHGECGRCLTEVARDVTARVREMYAYPGSATAETTAADEVPRIVDGLVDITELVHDELVLAMPAVPLCEPDCPGLCPDCGIRLAEAPADHFHEVIDPRWAGLARLFPDETGTGG